MYGCRYKAYLQYFASDTRGQAAQLVALESLLAGEYAGLLCNSTQLRNLFMQLYNEDILSEEVRCSMACISHG